MERDSCGTGFICEVDGVASRRVVDLALGALERLGIKPRKRSSVSVQQEDWRPATSKRGPREGEGDIGLLELTAEAIRD
jgi:hypothetical protein